MNFVFLCLLYIAPDENLDNFFDNFNTNVFNLISSRPDIPIVFGGDFNCRVADLNQLDQCIFYNVNNVFHTRSSDDKVNQLESKELVLLNGRCLGDVPAQFTFFNSRGASVIDLIWCSSAALPLILGLNVLHLSSSSDHFPVVLNISLPSHEFVNSRSVKLLF